MFAEILQRQENEVKEWRISSYASA